MKEKILEIRHLGKSYGNGKKAVDDLSLDVYAGDIYGFIGQNGAGKTTTLRSVTGILEFEEGEIFIDGISVKKQPVACKAVTAYIPDNPDLYEFLTGIQYLNFIGDMFGVEKSARGRRHRKIRRDVPHRGRPRLAREFLLARHEAETRHHRRPAARSQADGPGRTVRRAGPGSGVQAQAVCSAKCATRDRPSSSPRTSWTWRRTVQQDRHPQERKN